MPTRYDQMPMHARSAIHLGASAALPVLAVASLLSALVGCGSGRSSAQPALRLTPQDFAAAPSIANQGQAAVTATPVSVSGSAVTPGEAILVVGDQGAASPWAARSVPAPAKFAPVTAPGATSQAQPALAAAPPAPAAPPAGALVVDQMVGEINGKPLYASDFLQPLDARLRAEAQRLSPREWLQSTARTVHAALIDQVRDELLLAEFYASLKPEQRAGVLAYIQRLRTNIVSQNLGAEALADERLREREGLTIEEKVKQESERQLILEQLRREVYSRVVVSYRDIERYYETHFDEFNQAPSIKLRVIRANPDDADAVARALLDKPFAEVAAQYTKYNTSEQGLLVVSEPAAGTAPVFFGPQQLNDPAQALGVGETVGPIGYAGDEWWINYEALERNARTLYEAQDDIEAQLRQERFQVEQDRFFGEMLERARISDLETMVQRIVEFAAVRYLPNAGQ